MLALSLTGCATIHNIGRLNRIEPILEELVEAKDSGAKVYWCDMKPDERKLLCSSAREMGAIISSTEKCDNASFTK